MRRAVLATLIVSLLIAGWFSFARAREEREASVRAAPVWEYKLIYLLQVVSIQEAMKDSVKAVGMLEAKYNELGRDGWEFCESNNGTAVFKRLKP